MARSMTGCKQKRNTLRRNRVARQVLKVMHRENTQTRCVVMDRGAMLRHIVAEGAPLPDDPLLSAKITEKRMHWIKGACRRLVRLGHLVSKTVTRGGKSTQLYALPQNKEYL